MNDRTIYFDHAATTPLDTAVMNAMLPYFSDDFGNTSSTHWYGQRAESALEGARKKIADSMNANANKIIFTSGGTESDNLALRGCARKQLLANKDHILVSPVEHPAVKMTAEYLAQYEGFSLEYLPVDSFGIVDPIDVEKRIKSTTAMVSVIAAQNEIGSINPISELARICAERGVVFHTDAVQYAAHFPLDFRKFPTGMISLGAHKFYGPKGVGALIVSDSSALIPTQTGGGQEAGRRAGTHNTPLIVGMASAYEINISANNSNIERMRQLRDRIITGVLDEIPHSKLTGHPQLRLPNHASFIFERLDANILLMLLDQAGFCCSSGSACKSGNPKPSEILNSIGVSPDWALGSLRVTLGRSNTEEDVERFLVSLPGLVERGRLLS